MWRVVKTAVLHVLYVLRAKEHLACQEGARVRMRSEQEKLVYPDAAEALIAQFESRRRRRIKGEVDWGLPDRAASLAPGKRATVQPFNAGYRFSAFGAPAKDANTKLDVIAKELEGEPELHLLHAYCISHGGKRCRDPITSVIATELMGRLNADRGTVFARMKCMKQDMTQGRAAC